MIVQYIGRRGSGKTLTMVKDIVNHYAKGFKIYSNLDLYGIDYIHLESEEIIDLIYKTDVRDGVLAIDEIQTLIDSRKFMGKGNMTFSSFIQQMRKRRMIILATAQFINDVEIRFRKHVDITVRPKFLTLNSGKHLVKVEYIDITSQEDFGEPIIIKKLYDPQEIFKYYNTFEEQKPYTINKLHKDKTD